MFYHSKVQYGVPQDSVDLCCSLYITQAYHIIDLYNLMLGCIGQLEPGTLPINPDALVTS